MAAPSHIFKRFADLPDGAVARSRSGKPIHKLNGNRAWYPQAGDTSDWYTKPSSLIDDYQAPWTLIWTTDDPVEAYLMTGGA